MNGTPSTPRGVTGGRLRSHLVSGGLWALGGRSLAMIASVAVNMLLARLLTPHEMGVYFLTTSLVSIFTIVAQLGFKQAVVRLVAESLGTGNPGRARHAVRIVLRYGSLAAVVVAGFLSLGGAQWIASLVARSPAIAGMAGLVGLWVIVTALSGLLGEIFRGFHDIRLATLFSGLMTSGLAAVLFGVLWLLQGHTNLKEVVVLSIAAGATSTLLSWILLERRLAAMPPDSTLTAREVLIIAWPLLVTSIVLFLLNQADIWILAMYDTKAEIAIYGAASRLMVLVSVPLLIINAVLSPVIAEMFVQGKQDALQRLLRATATIAGIPAIVMLGVFVFLSGPILGMVYGSYYTAGGWVLLILSLGQFVNAWTGSCGTTLMMTGHQQTMMGITMLSGSVTVALALFLVERHGSIGVAGATAIGLSLQNVLLWIGVRVRTGIWTHMGAVTPAQVGKLLLMGRMAGRRAP